MYRNRESILWNLATKLRFKQGQNWIKSVRLTKRGFVLILLLVSPLFVLYTVNFSANLMTLARVDVQKPCKLHKLDPWDKATEPFMQHLPDIQCADKPTIMHINESGFLVFNKNTAKGFYALDCSYSAASRSGDKDVVFGDEVPIIIPTFVPCQIFRVICRDSKGQTLYDFVHANMGYNESTRRENQIQAETDDQLSIIFLGMDSASRSHVLRNLPKTYKLLTETLGSYDFKGYMKVGENSFPNLYPLLAGQNHKWQISANLLHAYMDKLPFIWNEPEMTGYATLHSEDRPDIATFNYIKGGFKNPPVDYYFRPFSLAMDQIEPVIGQPLGQSTWFCYGNKNHFHVQIEYLKDFITKYTGRKKFAFLWNNQMGHEDFMSIERADQPLSEFIHWLYNAGHLNRSILIVGSDHGYRIGGFSNTYLGRLENNMPFLGVYIPSVLKQKYKWMHRNLRHNSRQLVSAYDVHRTMINVIRSNYKDNNPSKVTNIQTSRSLFSKVPDNRNCDDAGIPPQFCTCDDMTSLETTLPLVQKMATYAVSHINSYFVNHTKLCSKLSLYNVTDVKASYSIEGDSQSSRIIRNSGIMHRLHQWLSGGTAQDGSVSGRYMLLFTTSPGLAVFEVMLEYEVETQSGSHDRMAVIGDPIRVNKYGNQSRCVTDSFLKTFCYCSDT